MASSQLSIEVRLRHACLLTLALSLLAGLAPLLGTHCAVWLANAVLPLVRVEWRAGGRWHSQRLSARFVAVPRR